MPISLPPDTIVVSAPDLSAAPDPLDVFREEHGHTHEAHALVHSEHDQSHAAMQAEIDALREELASTREAVTTPIAEAPTQVEEAPEAAAGAAGDVIELPAEAVETIPEKKAATTHKRKRNHAY